jgi:4-carboxymuconolactone decarboxylase
MIQRDPAARIPRVDAQARTDEMLDIIRLFAGPGRINVDENHVLNTFVHHPELARHFLTFNRYLLMSSTLPVRLRQIAIMRVAWIKKATYVWSSHLRTSLRNGLTGEEFDPIKTGEQSPYWSEEERIILRATDQAMENSNIDDATWQALTTILDQRQAMDFLFTVGAYALLGMVCNALRIDREHALLELAEKYGAPRV